MAGRRSENTRRRSVPPRPLRPAGSDADIQEIQQQLGKLAPIRGWLGGSLRRQLPDPTTEAGWARLWHLDVPGLTPQQRRRERWQLEVRIALTDSPDQVAPWFPERLERLSAVPVRPPGRPARPRRESQWRGIPLEDLQ